MPLIPPPPKVAGMNGHQSGSQGRDTAQSASPAPGRGVFVLSFHHADALAGILSAAGWQVTAATGIDGIPAADHGGDADPAPALAPSIAPPIAIVDARGAIDDGIAATAALAEVAGYGDALLVLVSHDDSGRIDALFDAGATHFLIDPETDDELLQAVRFADRHVARMIGGDATVVRDWIDRRIDGGGRPALRLLAVGGVDPVNRQQGRGAGDAILRAVERRIARVVRGIGDDDAAVARMGGTEFAVLLPGGDDPRLGTALADAIARPFASGATMAALTLRQSGGEAAPGEDATALVQRVRAAMPGARAGDPDRPVAPADAQRLAADILRAIEEDEIAILFQPQVNVADGTIVGVEALARWRHGRDGELGAELLFDSASRAGLAGRLSRHVQRAALVHAAAWPDTLSHLRLSINVTPEDVARADFVAWLLALTDDSGFPRDRLTIEITEGSLIADLDDAARLLRDLRAAGCRVAIDDFGTGYSSLAYLRALPLDYLKVDKRLTQDIAGTDRDRVVVRGVIAMARSLGLIVIAEGVETPEQRDALAADGCELYQGFLCAEPLETAALVELVGS